ncbi:MAG: APC family permease [Butyricicoccus sp.]
MNTKKLGLPSAISVCVGLIVASSCLLTLGTGMGLAGKQFILSMAIVLGLNTCLALSFGELHALMPHVDGGMGQYTKAGLGPVVSIVANTSAYVMVNLFAASVEIAMCGQVLSEIFLPMIPAPAISVTVLLILSYVNYRGVDLFARIQNIVVGLLLLSLIGMGIISFFGLGTGTYIPASEQTAPAVSGIGGVFSLSAAAFWLFIGIEFVIPVAKDLKNPKRDVTLSMILGIVMLFFIQAMLGAGMTHYVTLEELRTAELPHMVFAHNLLGRAGEVWMGIVTLLAGISTANTALGAVPNILAGMAESDLMPAIFARKNRHNVAVAGIVLIAGGDAIFIVTGFTSSAGLNNMLLAASCFWLTSYILISLTVLVLRHRYPHHPARNKYLTLGGIPQILCIVGNLYMIWNIAEGDARILIYKLFFTILAVLVAFAVIWVRGIKKQPLFAHAELSEINAAAADVQVA